MNKDEKDFFLYGILKTCLILPNERRNKNYLFDYKI